MIKKILSYVVVLTLAISFFTYKVSANGDSSISLPVELFDVDGDGLIYEYQLFNGMDTFGFTQDETTKVTKGLIKNTLDSNGNPVYTREAIESAAKTIHENLLSGKGNTAFTSNRYTIFDNFTKIADASGSMHDNVFGDNNNYFYTKGWSASNITNASNRNGQITDGQGIVWKQNTDGVENYGVADHLTKEIEVTPNTKYTFDYWRNDNGLKYKIIGANDAILLDNANPGTAFTVGNYNKITIDIYREANSGTNMNKFAIPTLTPHDNYDNKLDSQKSENYLGNTDHSTSFISKGWTSKDYSTANINGYSLVDGNIYWQQDGDGVICLKDSSIIYQTDIPCNQDINLYYYLGWGQYTNSIFSVDILDSNNNVLLRNIELARGNENFFNTNISVPNGTGNIKIRLNGKANSRIAALDITPKGKVLPLGSYEDTIRKRLTTIDDCTTCYDYAYLRLTNLFNTSFYLNKKDNTITSMKLNKDNTANGLSYSFDSSKKIKYDGNTFYNITGESAGFFPLDNYGEKLPQSDQENAPEHNYHFGMIVNGDFIYNKGADQFFHFTGDDDVYVFINNELVVDLGGAHEAASASIDIEDYAEKHNLSNGQKCSFKLFYLERHTTESNCKIQTNLNIGKHIEYNFVSGTEGKELPEAIRDLTPIDNTEYFDGQAIDVTNKTFNKVVVEDGVWEFVSWQKDKITINDEDGFIGTWVFTSNDKIVMEGTDNKDITETDTTKINTGDNTNVCIYLLLIMIAGLGLVHTFKKD